MYRLHRLSRNHTASGPDVCRQFHGRLHEDLVSTATAESSGRTDDFRRDGLCRLSDQQRSGSVGRASAEVRRDRHRHGPTDRSPGHVREVARRIRRVFWSGGVVRGGRDPGGRMESPDRRLRESVWIYS